jgi:VWFA-related protein
MPQREIGRRAFLGASLAAGLPGFAQQDEPLRIVVTTRLVQMSVVVHDGRGRPVNDLTREDFAVFDGGKPETITSFFRSAGERTAGPPQQAPSSGAESQPELLRTVTALVFDGLNTNMADQAFATEKVLRFLRNLRPGDSVALYLIATDLRLLHDFTDDPSTLVSVFEERKPELLLQWARERAPAVMRGMLKQDRASFTLAALRAVGQHLARIPGRKNLVWVTSGFPILIAEMENGRPGYIHSMAPEMQATARAIGDADVALYPVSAMGLVGMPQNSAAQGPPGRSMGRGSSSATGPQIVNSRQPGPLYSMMLSMAEQTGGQAFIESNDLDTALERATGDLASTYTLAFRPSHDRWNGEYRQLRVRLKRKGLKTRHRPGYVASPDQVSSAP